MHLTPAQARRFLLAYQGLWPAENFLGKAGVLAYVKRVGCIQYDPLNVVGHNPELVLQSRVESFKPAMLKELLYEDRALLDGWDKTMSIYSTQDWRYFQRWREAAGRNSLKSAEAVRAVLPRVRAELQARGPLSSADLDLDEIVDWDWSQSRLARAALESMYFWGELVVHHKVHTRKVYDFSHKCLPEGLLDAPDPNETEEQYQDWYVHRRIGSVGLLWNRAGEAWLGMYGIKSPQRKAALARLLAAGKVGQAEVDGIAGPFYFRTQDKPWLAQSLERDDPQPRAVIMAPLDNLLWDRRMLKEMFDFDYRWEVYVPAARRRYGYYVLPVLYGDRFIARFEPVQDKQARFLVIKNWWWERGLSPSEAMKTDLVAGLRRLMAYLGMDRLKVEAQAIDGAGLAWLPEVFDHG